jgi:hypothetical protein
MESKDCTLATVSARVLSRDGGLSNDEPQSPGSVADAWLLDPRTPCCDYGSA